jgi:hypothetical protein
MSTKRHSKPWEKSSHRSGLVDHYRSEICENSACTGHHSVLFKEKKLTEDRFYFDVEFEKLVLASCLCERITNNSKIKKLWLEEYLTTELSDESTIVCINQDTKNKIQMGGLIFPTKDEVQISVNTVWLSDVVGFNGYHYLVIESNCTIDLDEVERST